MKKDSVKKQNGFFVRHDFFVEQIPNTFLPEHIEFMKRRGNYFTNKEDAEKLADKILSIAMKKEVDDDFVFPDDLDSI